MSGSQWRYFGYGWLSGMAGCVLGLVLVAWRMNNQ